jgi:hypothetical protein
MEMKWDAARRVVPCGRSIGARSGAVTWRHRADGRAQMWAGAPTSKTGRSGSLGASHGGRAGFVESDSARPEKPGHRSRDDEAERRRHRRPMASASVTIRPNRAAFLGDVVRGHRLSPDGRLARIRGEANDSTRCGGFDLALRAGSRSEVAVDDPTAMGAGQHPVRHSQCRRRTAFRQGPVAGPVADPGPRQQEACAPGHHVTAKRGAERTRRPGPEAARRARGRSVGGAPGRRGARRDDRHRDGRRRQRRERRRELAIPLAIREAIPAGSRPELTTHQRAEPASNLSSATSPRATRARNDTGILRRHKRSARPCAGLLNRL